MFNMIAFAAIACIAQTEAHAGGCPATAVFKGVAETHRNGAIKWPTDYLLHVAFSERVVINGASAIVQVDQATIFIDPVGKQEQYRCFGRPNIVVMTRAHPDHLSIDTMIGMLRRDTVVLAPQAVIDLLPLMIANNVITATGEVRTGIPSREHHYRLLELIGRPAPVRSVTLRPLAQRKPSMFASTSTNQTSSGCHRGVNRRLSLRFRTAGRGSQAA